MTFSQHNIAAGGVMTPGGPAQKVTYHIENPANFPQTVGSFAVTINTATLPDACTAADFVLPAVVTLNTSIAANSFYESTFVISYTNDLVNDQSDCQLLSVPLVFTANAL